MGSGIPIPPKLQTNQCAFTAGFYSLFFQCVKQPEYTARKLQTLWTMVLSFEPRFPNFELTSPELVVASSQLLWGCRSNPFIIYFMKIFVISLLLAIVMIASAARGGHHRVSHDPSIFDGKPVNPSCCAAKSGKICHVLGEPRCCLECSSPFALTWCKGTTQVLQCWSLRQPNNIVFEDFS